jgi:EmrB/QacA subfamily drug resistance transporter
MSAPLSSIGRKNVAVTECAGPAGRYRKGRGAVHGAGHDPHGRLTTFLNATQPARQEAGEDEVRKYAGNPWLVLLVVSLGFFMTLLDLTIVNIAIPNMITKLHASLDDVLWVINAYALVLAVLVITAGRLGDLIGPRTLFIAGVAVFTAASVACGLSPSAGWLIGFRAVQGLGAAMLMPQTLTIITNTFPPERRGAAFGVWGAVAGVATIAGPTLGGLLVTAFDWRYIFFVNLPIGVAVLVLTVFIIPDLRLGRRHRIDIPGVVLATAALLAICYGLVEGQKYHWGTITSFISIPLILGAGLVLLVVFLLYQKLTQSHEPLIPFAVFRDRNFSVMNWVSGVLAIGMMGIFLPFTIYLQSVLGFSALKAGLAMAPASLISIFIAPVAGRMTDRIGGKYILMSGLILFGGGMGWLALIARPDSSWQSFLVPLIVAGFGMGCVFAPLITVAMRNIQPQMAGAASGVLNTVRQVGLVIGTAAVGALLQNRLVSTMTSQAASRSAALPPQVRGRFVHEIQNSANNGIQVGAGQNGGMTRQSGLPAGLAAEVARIGHDVFTFGYVAAMRSTMILPVVLLGVGALSCLALRERKPSADAHSPAVEAPTVPDAAVTDVAVMDAAVAEAAVAEAEPSTRLAR